jgi:hypothetical protein
MVPMRDFGTVEVSHETGRADLRLGPDAQQRVPPWFTAREQVRLENRKPMRVARAPSAGQE